MSMKRILNLTLSICAAVALAACGNGEVSASDAADATSTARLKNAAQETPKAEREYDGTVRKPGSPFAMSYRIVGTPIVGSPVIIDLRVDSMLGSREVTMDYRINDLAALSLHEAQPDRVRIAPAEDDRFILQRVTVVPQREGRIYLNVSASYETEEGSASAIMAVPIQVGAGGRELQENGEVQLDEDGEAVRVLSGD